MRCALFLTDAYYATHLVDLQPTNHLDIEGLDALMLALSKWNGGVIIISHDERFITSVAKELWVCGEQTVKKFYGDVQAYKVCSFHLREGRLLIRAEFDREQREEQAVNYGLNVHSFSTPQKAIMLLEHRAL